MKKQTKTKHVLAGGYVAKVEVELIKDETGWKDKVREALKNEDLETAAQYGEIYEMRQVP